MPKRYVGCKEATEVSLCKVDPASGRFGGANPGSFVLMAKNRKTPVAKTNPSNPGSEIHDMTPEEVAAEVAKAQAAAVAKTAAWTDDVRKHYIGLDETAQAAFMAKTVKGQLEEAEAAKSAREAEAIAKAAKEKGITEKEAAMQKSLDETRAQLAEMQKTLAERDSDAVVVAKARHSDYAGFPGGEERLVPMLKSLSSMPEDTAKAFEDTLKAQAVLARNATKTHGLLTDEEMEKALPATAKMQKAVSEIMKAEKIGRPAAVAKFREQDAETYAAAVREETEKAA